MKAVVILEAVAKEVVGNPVAMLVLVLKMAVDLLIVVLLTVTDLLAGIQIAAQVLVPLEAV